MSGRLLTIVSGNPIWLVDERLTVDRKFHDGFMNYVSHLDAPLLAVNAVARSDEMLPMDTVTLDTKLLPYRVLGLVVDRLGRITPQSATQFRDAVRDSALVYGGPHRSHSVATELNVPHVAWLENDLGTQMDLARLGTPSKVRGVVRALRAAADFLGPQATCLRGSRLVHCNGYPAARAAARYNSECLMYLDSRMKSESVIEEQALERRLVARNERPLRLLFSGRYEAIKGADHAVRVALECLHRGLEVEMDCYGQGPLAARMRQDVASAGAADKVRVHDSIPFSELVRRSHEADVFVCCHLQSDPSCTYIESMGAGLPIAGYPNRMWSAMQHASQAGEVSSRRTPVELAHIIGRWIADPAALAAASRKARSFAVTHCFEAEFKRRTDSLGHVYLESVGT